MSAILQFEKKHAAGDATMSPGLRSFLDSVIVPLLVNQALSTLKNENDIESGPHLVPECAKEVASAEAFR